MVALLALVLIAMKMAANPRIWHWLFPAEVAEQPADATNRGSDNRQIDFRVRFEDVEIDKKILEPVRDNTLGVRHDEADAFYAILAKARDIPLSDLERVARDDVGFAVLMADSDHFRGTLITVRGEIKRLSKLKAGKNQHNIDVYYEAWLFTADSGINPYRIVCTSIPKGIPQGERITKPVRVCVTGYFFKREGYASQGGLHTAPTLLAKRLRWYPPQVAQTEDSRLTPYVVGFVILVAAGLGVTLWRFTAGDKRFYRRHIKRITEAPREAIDALADVETTDPDEMFRQLTEQARMVEVTEPAEASGVGGEKENGE